MREDSRVMRGASGLNYSMDTLLSAIMADELATLIWQRTKDGANGTNQPKKIVNLLLESKKESEIQSFDTPEEFEQRRKELMEM